MPKSTNQEKVKKFKLIDITIRDILINKKSQLVMLKLDLPTLLEYRVASLFKRYQTPIEELTDLRTDRP